MDYSTSCKYSIRLTEKLKPLDTQNVLDFELIHKAIYYAKNTMVTKKGSPASLITLTP